MELVTHSFMVIPQCLYQLLERDPLAKLRAQINFKPGEVQLMDQKVNSIQMFQKLTLNLSFDMSIDFMNHQLPWMFG